MCDCAMCVGGCDGVKEGETEADRQTETDGQTNRDRHTHRETEG